MAQGDHIRVKRLGGLYHHHGIDVGDGSVVHFSGEPFHWKNASVVREALDDFLRGYRPEVVEYGEEARPVETVVATALEHVGQGGYNLWTNNCEHFACHCKTGLKDSRQIRRVLRSAAVLTAGVVVVGAALTVRALVRGGRQTTDA